MKNSPDPNPNTPPDHSADTWFDQQFIEASPLGTILVDAQEDDLPIRYVNKAFERTTGYTAREVIGKNARFLHRNDKQQPDLDILRAAIRNQKAVKVILRNYRKDGTLFWNELHISPIVDTDGNLTHFVGIQNDITHRKQVIDHLQFLSRTATELLNINDEQSVYDYVGRELQTLLDDAIIVINKVKDENHTINQGIYGLDETLLGRVMKKLGFSPIGHTYAAHPEAKRYFSTGKLETYEGGLAEWAKDQISPFITRELAKIAQIHRLYFIGLQKDGKLFADVQIYTRYQQTITYPQLVETFIQQASTAIQRIQSETYYRLLAENARDLIYRIRLKPDMRFEYVSPSATEMIGYTPEDHYADPQLGFKLVHPDDHHILEAAAQNPSSEPVMLRWVRKDGSIFWSEQQNTPIFDEDGDIIAIEGIARDVTHRKEAEDALRRSEERFKMVLEGTHAGSWEWNITTNELILNERWANLIGYTLDELKPTTFQTWEKLVNPNDLPKTVDILERHFSGELDQYEVEFRMKHKAGHWVWILARGKVLEWTEQGEPLRMFGTHQDVTERKHMQEALKLSEERYRNAIEAGLDAFYLLESVRDDGGEIIDFRIVEINERAVNEMGLPREELIGGQICELFPVNRSNGYFEQYKQVVLTGQPLDQDYSIPSEYTAPGWYHHQVVKVGDGVAIVNRNITEQWQAQQREFEIELEKQRLNLLTQFIQNAAHEFRTPLSTIGINTYMIMRAKDEDKRAEKAENIQFQVQRVTRLVDMLLKMARLEMADSSNYQEVQVNEIVDVVCQELRYKGDEHAPTIDFKPAADLPVCMGDYTLLMEAIAQILENAYRFTPDDETITITSAFSDGQIVITITDAGPGISEDDQKSIFETFWRQDEAHSTPGFGLGLSLAHKIITMHGGDISVESTPGKGATFIITLPVLSEA